MSTLHKIGDAMKKLLFSILMACMVASSLQAHGRKHPPKPTYEGFYVNFSVGGNNFLNQVSAIQTNGTPAGKANMVVPSITGGVGVRYLRKLPARRLVGGVEVEASVNRGAAKSTLYQSAPRSAAFALKAKSPYTYSAAVLVGTGCKCMLTYLKIGVVVTKIHIKATPLGSMATVTEGFSVKKNITGVLIGAGAQKSISTSLSLGAEYNYAAFVKKVSCTDPQNVEQFTFKNTNVHTFKIKLSYKI